MELASVSAISAPAGAAAAAPIDLATFDEKSSHTWKTESDPVMGGQSDSTFVVKGGYGVYAGTCRIVPSLRAPGFTIALTETPLLHQSFPDVSSMDGLILGLRNVEP